jgi:hypothetical protein
VKTLSTGKKGFQGCPQGATEQAERAAGVATIVDAPSSSRTRTLSVAPVLSMTVTRAKPGPFG